VAHQPLRRIDFGVFADRLGDLMNLVVAVAFQRLEQRLAAALPGHGPTVQTTQQALVDEPGAGREIVTRLLKRFEQAAWVSLARERIELRDALALRVLSAGATLRVQSAGATQRALSAGATLRAPAAGAARPG
jgi:CRP/FNR family transcriptional regulator